jgi:hypothetical protein
LKKAGFSIYVTVLYKLKQKFPLPQKQFICDAQYHSFTNGKAHIRYSPHAAIQQLSSKQLHSFSLRLGSLTAWRA